MDTRLLVSADELAAYDRWVRAHPQGSLWQSIAWKEFQEALGRTTRVYAAFENANLVAGALVIIDATTGGYATWEVPRGPVARDWLLVAGSIMKRITEDARKERCLALFASPQSPLLSSNEQLVTSNRHIFPDATRILDLTLNDNDLLAQMKPKGRYNIRLAERHGIEVRENADVDAFHRLMLRTTERDQFTGQSLRHYKDFLEHLPGSFLLLAYHPNVSDSEPIAGFIGVRWEKTGIYYYGASDDRYRNFMAPYLLQWQAMKRCRQAGCTRYDLLGVAPENSGDNHPWAGITGFKEKFGGELVTYPPEQEVVLKPMIWHLLKMKRRIVG